MNDHLVSNVTVRTLRGLSPEALNDVCGQAGGDLCGVTFRTLRGLSPRAVNDV